MPFLYGSREEASVWVYMVNRSNIREGLIQALSIVTRETEWNEIIKDRE